MNYIKHNFLAILALITSIIAIYFANQSNTIAETENAPFIWSYIEHIYDKNLNFITQDVLIVTNDGAPVIEVTSTAAVLMDVQLSDPNGLHSSVNVISLNGYYFGIFPVNQSTGILKRITGDKNNHKFFALNNDFMELARLRSKSGYLSLRRYLKVVYKDKSGNQNIKYFFVDPVKSSRELPKDKGKEIFEIYDAGFASNRVIDIDRHTALDIFEKI